MTVFVIDWASLGPTKFLFFISTVVIFSVWSEWRRG
jgi:hypothetical protein